jgi:hypothetical protein
METRSSNSELVNITQLPYHTKREVIVGKIFDLINERSDGFSINRNLQPPTFGYMVGTKWNVVHFDKSTTRAEIEKYVDEFLSLEDNLAVWLGGWKSDDGTNYIEYSQRFYNKSSAIEIAQKYGEISIWDVIDKKEIEIKY